MAPLGELAKKVGKKLSDNSPGILTAVGVTGALTTAYLAGHASYKACLVIEEAKRHQPVMYGTPKINVPPKEFIKRTWKFYIPAAVSAALTTTAIICANRIGTRRAAALAVAYSVSEKAFEEYRKKVVEKLGEKKEEAIRDEVNQDRVNQNPVGSREVIITGKGEVLCYDAYSGRYFRSDMEDLRKAQNDINFQIVHDSFASLTDFYDRIGLARTSVSDEVGWNLDKQLELKFSGALSEDNKPCMVVDFTVSPIRNYHRLQ